MIEFECSSCGKGLKVKDELAGKKVKCPGCQKPVGVPQPAASVSPPPAAREDERTLPPKVPSVGDERTLPPKQPKESLSDADARTNLGAGHAESTQAFQAAGHTSELTDFLAPAQGPDEIGRLGGFRILKVLGHGGMGVVFLGEDPKLGRNVAIKAMLPDLAESKSAQQRFLREARAAAALEHDHIVHINHVAEDRGAPFIVMPFLQGEPLDERLKREKALPVAEVLRIGRETAKGLAAAHKRGLIHRDIKPANLWLEGEDARVKILDFGLARAATGETGLTQTGAIVGTPQYMAPEQAAGKKDIDHRCDLFSLGCVLYRMCTGQLPFKGDDTLAIISALAMDKPKEPSKLDKNVPKALSNLIMHLLAKNPDHRPQSAHEVAEALAQLAAKETAQMPAKLGKTALFQKPRPTAARLKWTLVGGSVLGLAVLGLVVFFLTSRERQRPEDGPQSGSLSPTFTNSLGMELVLVPKGKSWLGSNSGKPGDKEVDILHDFYLGKYEVTQEEWEKVTGNNPSNFKELAGVSKEDQKRFPVEMISWHDCQIFIESLNKQVKEAGWVYRLPKDAEWEYACRGGPLHDKLDSAFDFYFDIPTKQLLPDQANFSHEKGLARTCKVGSYKANRLGLSDMHGSVWEWCDDEVPDPNNPKGASFRATRGGSWNSDSGLCRAAHHGASPPSYRDRHLGLRLARVLVGKETVAPVVSAAGDPDRRAALWALSVGGVVIVKEMPGKYLDAADKLPPGKITVTSIGLNKPDAGVNDAGLENLRNLAELTEIGLGDHGAARATDKGLAILATNKSLKLLHVGGGYAGKLTDAGLEALRGLPGLTNLKLSQQGLLTDQGLTFMRHLKELDRLDVSASGMTADAVIATARESWPKITALNLFLLPITEKGLQELAQLRSLRELDLGRVKVQEFHLRHLGALPQLTRLSLFETNISDVGLEHLRTCAGLTLLYLTKNKLSAAGVAKLQQALPKCRIEWDGGVSDPSKKAAITPPKFTNSLGAELVYLAPGKFTMGSPSTEAKRENDEDLHEVEITAGFHMGIHEVTQAQFQQLMGYNPSAFSEKGMEKAKVAGMNTDDFPVENVTWQEAVNFCQKLSQLAGEKAAGRVYRLPTEAEWEYACRARTTTPFHFGPSASATQANFWGHMPYGGAPEAPSLARTTRVGSFKPNGFGLYDMHGNVSEWCADY